MNILLLSDDMILGGVARHIIDIATALTTEGHSVTIAATDGNMRQFIPESVGFVPLFLKDNTSMKSRYIGYFHSMSVLKETMRLGAFDLIHSHKRFAHLLGKRLSKRFSVPHITSYHTDFTRWKFLSVYGDMTVCCAKNIRDTILSDGHVPADRMCVIYNGVHQIRLLDQVVKERFIERFSVPKENIIIGSVGQFVPEKDRPSLLSAVHTLRQRNDLPPFTLLVQGFGPQHDRLLSMCNDLTLRDIVRFIPGDEPVESVSSVSDFMVINSLTEGFPLIILEAASAGVAHIGSAISGIPEFIEHKVTGLLVAQGDTVQLSSALEELLKEPALRISMGAAAKKKYLEHFTFERMISEYRTLYNDTVNRRVRSV